jgi:oligopeptide transport system substrate-binding protein
MVHFYFLGGFDMRCNQQALLKPPTQKSQSLLAYLVLQRKQPRSREHLINLFWGERPEQKARRSLTTALWHLRRCLPKGNYLLSDYSSVQFNPQENVWVDVDEFSQLVQSDEPKGLIKALNLYGGTLLDGFYDDWVINERYRLEIEYQETLARLMIIQQFDGKYPEALKTAQCLVENDALREDAHRVIMHAYSQMGQNQAALQQYQRLCQALKQELGIEPAYETRELYQAIRERPWLNGTPYQIPVEEKSEKRSTVVVSHPLETPRMIRFVGREKELEALEECWREVRSGCGMMVFVSGEAGVGKSRLLEEFSNQRRWQGVEVLYGRCYEFERMLPYQPVVDGLRSILLNLKRAELENFPDWVLDKLAYLIPELVDQIPELSSRSTGRWEEDRNQLFEAILTLLAILGSRGGLLLVIEDLQWASEATLQLIHYLVRNLSGNTCMIAGTSRLEGMDDRQPGLEMVEQLEQDGLALIIQLAPLTATEVEQLVMEMSGAGAQIHTLAQWLYQETEGNPFFLIETVKALYEAGLLKMEEGIWKGDFQRVKAWKSKIPTRISQLIKSRLRRLDKNTLEILKLAAVIGCEFDFDLLYTAQGRGEEEILTAIDGLLRSRLIDESSRSMESDYVFSHHKIQEVVYQSIPFKQKSRMHALVAQTLEKLFLNDTGRITAELAFHYLHAGRQNREYIMKSISYSIEAGNQSRILYAHEEAIDHYQRALNLLEEERDYERAARTYMLIAAVHHSAFDFKSVQQALDYSFKLWKQAASKEKTLQMSSTSKVLRLPWQDPLSLDPAKAFNVYAWGIIKQIFGRLVEYNPDGEIFPDIAKTWEVSENGRQYIFHLRDDVLWSDGTRLTAMDFEFAWKRLLDPTTGWIHASLMYDIKGGRAFHQKETFDINELGVFALDETTLVVELEEPTGYFLSLLGYVYAVPRHVVDELGDRWAEVENIVTNGAFLVKKCCRTKLISLVRNPNYYGKFHGNIKEVYLEINPLQEFPALLQQYQENVLDALDLSNFPPEEINPIRSRYAGEYLSGPDLLSYSLGFDMSRPPFDDRRVRLAFVKAINRELMVESLFNNYALVANGGFVPPGMPGHCSGIGLAYDPEQARRLLAEAGYPKGLGFPQVDALYLDNPYRNPINDYLRQQWLEVLEIESTWEVASWEEYVNRILNQPPYISAMTWVAQYNADPSDCLQVGISHARIFTKWINQSYDALVEQARLLTDQGERLKLFAQAERILIEEVALFPLIYGQVELLVKPYLKQISLSRFSDWSFKDILSVNF